jgi:hypothetical protein
MVKKGAGTTLDHVLTGEALTCSAHKTRTLNAKG